MVDFSKDTYIEKNIYLFLLKQKNCRVERFYKINSRDTKRENLYQKFSKSAIIFEENNVMKGE